MNNYIKFPNNNIAIILKYLFHISNILLIIFYLYPGSIFGCFIYKDCGVQPQLTGDFVGNSISSNHFYIFSVISLLGFIAYSKKKTFLIITTYLFLIAVFLELAHIIIPVRGYQVEDLAGNILGVVISLIIFFILKLGRKNE